MYIYISTYVYIYIYTHIIMSLHSGLEEHDNHTHTNPNNSKQKKSSKSSSSSGNRRAGGGSSGPRASVPPPPRVNPSHLSTDDHGESTHESAVSVGNRAPTPRASTNGSIEREGEVDEGSENHELNPSEFNSSQGWQQLWHGTDLYIYIYNDDRDNPV